MHPRHSPPPLGAPTSVGARKPSRGFVMLVIAAVMLILFAALTATLASVRQNRVIALRQNENARARDLAEACLAKGVAIAHAHFAARGGNDFDFDQLLDPNLIPGDGDDYVYAELGSTIQTVPPAAPDPQGLHRYVFTRLNTASPADPIAEGGCYLRFDDNDDDSLPGYLAQTSNHGALEGPTVPNGANVPNRDRDASIAVTAIGVFPARPSTPDAAVYDSAHARMTLRQFFTATASPAVYGNGNVSIDNNVEVCGTGGVRGVAVTVDLGSCICGDALAQSITPGIAECTPAATECPDGAAVSPNNPTTLPTNPTRATDFPTRCSLYAATVGEPPPAVVVADTVGTANTVPDAFNALTPVVTPYLDNFTTVGLPGGGQPKLRLYFRNDGAVFAWDGRASTNAAAATLATSVPDCSRLFPPFAPPVPPSPTVAVKNATCSAVQAGATCAVTAGVDIESCVFAPALPAVRCDGLGPAWPPTPPQAAKDALCNGAVPGATCVSTPALDDAESCALPGQYVNCRAQPGGGTLPAPLTSWTSFANEPDDASALPANRPQYCWRMVAKLDGTPPVAGVDANSDGDFDDPGDNPPEWEDASGAFAITSALPPNQRLDPFLEVRNGVGVIVPPRVEDIAQMRTTQEAAAGTTRFTPPPLAGRAIATHAPGMWRTTAGWHNQIASNRALPTPALMLFETDVTVSDGLQLDSTTFVSGGDITVEGGNHTVITAADVRSDLAPAALNPFAYTGGFNRCSLDVNETVAQQWAGTGQRSVTPGLGAGQAAASRYVLRARGHVVIQGEATLFGRISAGGDVDVQGDDVCLVGGVSADGNGTPPTMDARCNSGACGLAEMGVCFERQTSVIGDVYTRGDAAAPRGLMLSRGTNDSKAAFLASDGNDVCLRGPSRIVGQVVSTKTNGDIEIGSGVLFLHSGEVGYGFGTKRSVFSDATW